MGVPVFSQLGVAGAVPGQGLIDTKPLTALTASPVIIPVPWPDTTQTRIAVFRSVMRLHIIKNDDPNIYAGVALFLRAVDQAIMGVAILDAGMPGWSSSPSGGILGLVDREIDVAPDFFVVQQSQGFFVTFKPFSLNSVASDANMALSFRADIDLAYAWSQVDSRNRLIDGVPTIVQVESTGWKERVRCKERWYAMVITRHDSNEPDLDPSRLTLKDRS